MTAIISAKTASSPHTANEYHDCQHRYGSQNAQALTDQSHSVFQIDQAVLRPPTGKSSHWSIAWSDLMMTMFILFLCLFVYQAAHKDFLVDKKDEIVAGDTRPAQETKKDNGSSLPFALVEPSPPLITAGTIKKVEPIVIQEMDLDTIFPPEELEAIVVDEKTPMSKQPFSPPKEVVVAVQVVENGMIAKAEPAKEIFSQTLEDVFQPMPLNYQESSESVNTLFSRSQHAVDIFNLNEFASVDLVPNKAMRIVLTGDLLFETGHAALSLGAIQSLEKIASSIKETEYQIHIEGHTDNVPIRSNTFANNWELSLARAKAVATFLIQDMKMNPENIVISGYSSYRPVAPNTTDQNRSQNRRVEIVISKSPQEEQSASLKNHISANYEL